MWWIGTAVSLFAGYLQSRSNSRAGDAARAAAQENAADLRDLGSHNAAAITEAGYYNAGIIREIGEINAQYIEKSTERNIALYGMQASEDERRHIRAEVVNAGSIRAKVSGSGVQTNTGSPLHYLNSQVSEGIRQRRYMVIRHFETMKTMHEDGADRAYVTRATADGNAKITIKNAETQASMAIANAEAQAQAQERSGEVAHETADANANAAIIGAIADVGVDIMANYGGGGNIPGVDMGAVYSPYTPGTYNQYVPGTYNAFDPPVATASGGALGGKF